MVRLVSVGNLEAAVSLLLSTSPESSYFYANALRAVALSSAVSTSLLELAVKVLVSSELLLSKPIILLFHPLFSIGSCSQYGQK